MKSNGLSNRSANDSKYAKFLFNPRHLRSRSSIQLFSKQEMETVLDDMEQEMRGTFRDELEIFYRMSGVFIQMLMYDAEKQSSTIKAEVNFMENYKALTDMREFEDFVMNDDFKLVKRPKINAQLAAPVRVEKVIVQDEALQEQNRMLQRQVTEL